VARYKAGGDMPFASVILSLLVGRCSHCCSSVMRFCRRFRCPFSTWFGFDRRPSYSLGPEVARRGVFITTITFDRAVKRSRRIGLLRPPAIAEARPQVPRSGEAFAQITSEHSEPKQTGARSRPDQGACRCLRANRQRRVKQPPTPSRKVAKACRGRPVCIGRQQPMSAVRHDLGKRPTFPRFICDYKESHSCLISFD